MASFVLSVINSLTNCMALIIANLSISVELNAVKALCFHVLLAVRLQLKDERVSIRTHMSPSHKKIVCEIRTKGSSEQSC